MQLSTAVVDVKGVCVDVYVDVGIDSWRAECTGHSHPSSGAASIFASINRPAGRGGRS